MARYMRMRKGDVEIDDDIREMVKRVAEWSNCKASNVLAYRYGAKNVVRIMDGRAKYIEAWRVEKLKNWLEKHGDAEILVEHGNNGGG